MLVVHLAQPRPKIRDRGKTSVAPRTPSSMTLIVDAVKTVTRHWTRQRKAEEKAGKRQPQPLCAHDALATRHARRMRPTR